MLKNNSGELQEGSHSKVHWENAKKVWYYEKWVGYHASFPPRRSVNTKFCKEIECVYEVQKVLK